MVERASRAAHPPGSEWLSLSSFVLGLIDVFLTVGLTAWLFALIYNVLEQHSLTMMMNDGMFTMIMEAV